MCIRDRFYFLLQKYIHDLRSDLESELTRDSVLDTFELELDKAEALNLIGLDKKLTHEVLLPTESDLLKDCDFEMRTPSGAHETSRYNLLMFTLIRKIRYLLIGACKNPPEKQKQMLLKKSPSSAWKLGFSYEMDFRSLIPCTIVNPGDPTSPSNAQPTEFKYIVEDQDNLILIEQDLDTGLSKILVNTAFKHVEAMIDRAEPRIIFVAFKDKAENDKDANIMLKFEDLTHTLRVMRMIEENQKTARNNDLYFALETIRLTEEDFFAKQTVVQYICFRRICLQLRYFCVDAFFVDISLFACGCVYNLSLIHISEPTRRTPISYAVFCLKKKKLI
eukprot:TRINITY_DN5093_c0_g1_i4.p1 TRINITY_DN5093_c0_g1~~TRINITY_DN5093_c0_g1_i4.p1  ORF type:complete len:334 (+),score=68.17 TRINITY_DN5093_c0_g1_i4:77-1078(+)